MRIVIATAVALLLLSAALFGIAGGEIVIDIVKAPRPLPIAVQALAGPRGAEISNTIANDLAMTGLFQPLDPAAFIELPVQSFDRSNWTIIGAEAAVKGSVKLEEGKVNASVALYDVFEGRAILKKDYVAEERLTRQLAHAMANDIYKAITGQEGVFRSKIAFVAQEGKSRRLHLMDWDGERRRPLGQAADIILTPHWSGDTDKLLYSVQRGRRWEVVLLNLITMKEAAVFAAEGTTLAGDFFPGSEEFALSSSKEGTPDIYVYNMKDAGLTRLTKDPGIEVTPAVSPDGQTIAYVSDRGGSAQIYTMDRFGYNIKRLTFDTGQSTAPVWSPRGDRIAFAGYSGGRHQIYTVRPDGSEMVALTSEGNNEDPSFSPDGRFIAFTSDRGGRKGIFIMRSNGEGQRRITPPEVTAHSPRWSPK